MGAADQGNHKKRAGRNSINLVFLSGNLTRDPVLRRTSSGVALADMGLALSDSWSNRNGEKGESVCFVDVIVWERQAEACAQYLAKGSPVFIEGRLQFDEWTDKEGARRNKVKVRAERVQFLGHPKSTAAGADVDDVEDDAPPAKTRR
ncbi:MAG: single-stranded DNA-binding protein [bacterium]